MSRCKSHNLLYLPPNMTTQLNVAKFCKYIQGKPYWKKTFTQLPFIIYVCSLSFLFMYHTVYVNLLTSLSSHFIFLVGGVKDFVNGICKPTASYSSSLDEYPEAVEWPCTFWYGSAWWTTSVPHVENKQWPPRTWTSYAAPAPKMLQRTTWRTSVHAPCTLVFTTRAFLAMYIYRI